MTSQTLATSVAPPGAVRDTRILALLRHHATTALVALRARAARNRSLAELDGLTDHALADIGLSRDDLTWARHLPSDRDAVAELQAIVDQARPGPRRRAMR